MIINLSDILLEVKFLSFYDFSLLAAFVRDEERNREKLLLDEANKRTSK